MAAIALGSPTRLSETWLDAPRWAITMENATVVPTTASTRSFTATTSKGATAGGGTVDVGAAVVVAGAAVATGAAGGVAGGIVVVGAGAVIVTPATRVGTNLTVLREVFFAVLVTRFSVVFVERFTVDAEGAAEAPGTPAGGDTTKVNTNIALSTATDRRVNNLGKGKRRSSTLTIVSRTRADSSDSPMRA